MLIVCIRLLTQSSQCNQSVGCVAIVCLIRFVQLNSSHCWIADSLYVFSMVLWFAVKYIIKRIRLESIICLLFFFFSPPHTVYSAHLCGFLLCLHVYQWTVVTSSSSSSFFFTFLSLSLFQIEFQNYNVKKSRSAFLRNHRLNKRNNLADFFFISSLYSFAWILNKEAS